MTDNADARPRATLLLTRPREASEGFAAEIAQEVTRRSISSSHP
jgi:hypothetical protein